MRVTAPDAEATGSASNERHPISGHMLAPVNSLLSGKVLGIKFN